MLLEHEDLGILAAEYPAQPSYGMGGTRIHRCSRLG